MENDHTHELERPGTHESTIVNSVSQLRLAARGGDSEVPTNANQGSDLILLSSERPNLSAAEEQQEAWLKANRGRNTSVTANQVFTYRPPMMVLSMGQSSPLCLNALNAAAGRFA